MKPSINMTYHSYTEINDFVFDMHTKQIYIHTHKYTCFHTRRLQGKSVHSLSCVYVYADICMFEVFRYTHVQPQYDLWTCVHRRFCAHVLAHTVIYTTRVCYACVCMPRLHTCTTYIRDFWMGERMCMQMLLCKRRKLKKYRLTFSLSMDVYIL